MSLEPRQPRKLTLETALATSPLIVLARRNEGENGPKGYLVE